MSTIAKTAFAAALLLSGSPALAEDAHHPATTSSPAASPAPEAAAPPPAGSAPAGGSEPTMPGGMTGGGQMGGDMMKMMQEMMGRHTGMMRGMMADGAGMQDGMMGKMIMAPEHVEGRIAFLRTELKVTDAQQPLWEAVAAALRENARASTGMMQQEADARGLPASLERREQQLSARLEAVQRLRAAVEPFYASLDEAQKTAADSLLMPMGMM